MVYRMQYFVRHEPRNRYEVKLVRLYRRINKKFVARRDAGCSIETIWSRLKKVEAEITKRRVWAI